MFEWTDKETMVKRYKRYYSISKQICDKVNRCLVRINDKIILEQYNEDFPINIILTVDIASMNINFDLFAMLREYDYFFVNYQETQKIIEFIVVKIVSDIKGELIAKYLDVDGWRGEE